MLCVCARYDSDGISGGDIATTTTYRSVNQADTFFFTLPLFMCSGRWLEFLATLESGDRHVRFGHARTTTSL